METQKPTPAERLQVFLNYHGHNFDNGRSGYLNYPQILAHKIVIAGSKTDGYTYFIAGYPIQKCSIRLKPLGKISDEDKVFVNKIESELHYGSESGDATYFGKTWDLCGFIVTLDGISCDLCVASFQYLQEKGYALPYKNWSVEQLVEFGIYKLID